MKMIHEAKPDNNDGCEIGGEPMNEVSLYSLLLTSSFQKF